MSRLQNLTVSTNHALKSGTFAPDAFRDDLARSGLSDALAAARETLTWRFTAQIEEKHRTEQHISVGEFLVACWTARLMCGEGSGVL
ncbi:hypothetical protein C1I97_08395 [Streptomyces sp. NTH33]|uniref:hypothetical protein n=1 Tax=Streptomyces sp. NTH33 TaxID=1735453 RepID=UPI000DA70441|nr:hypothetical protein [Streptomyces sp. NTH33]PZH15341.1 hypothetical protein C1I97_08395 [Streptomyces sp. NTH33]